MYEYWLGEISGIYPSSINWIKIIAANRATIKLEQLQFWREHRKDNLPEAFGWTGIVNG